MSYAPQTLLDARHVYQKYTGLPNNSVGIVGDENHNGGYHCGWDLRKTSSGGQLNDYSWQESSRDWNHKTDAASAIDFGNFQISLNGHYVTLLDFNLWIVKQLDAQAPDTLDVREFIYTPDGSVVKRWDRLKKRTSGDDSHLTHSHLSRFRDAENNPLAPLVQRFFSQYLGVDMYMLKVEGDENPAIYLSNGINTRSLPEGQWPLTGQPLRDAGVPTFEYPDLESLFKGGGPLLDTTPEEPTIPVSGTINISGGVLNVGPPSEG